MLLMMKFVLCCLVLGISTLLNTSVATPSTPHFPQVFLGKCFERNPTGVDCDALFGNFSKAAMTDNSNVTDALYEPFFALADFSTPENQSLFWSGAYTFATAISNDPRFYTMEETPTGYILNGLSWCGTPEHTFDYVNNCLFPTNATYYGTSGVWSKASEMFGKGASGDVYVLLQLASNGANPPEYQAYRNASIFATTELPSMRVEHVRSVTALVLKNTTLAPHEHCGSGSLQVLNEAVKTKFNFTLKCIDDPTDLFNLLCPQNVVSAQCMAASLVYKYETTKGGHNYEVWAISVTAVAGVLFLLVIVMLLALVFGKRKSYTRV